MVIIGVGLNERPRVNANSSALCKGKTVFTPTLNTIYFDLSTTCFEYDETFTSEYKIVSSGLGCHLSNQYLEMKMHIQPHFIFPILLNLI